MARLPKKETKINYYDSEYLAELLGVESHVFHREIKPLIIMDFREELRSKNIKNPDIGLDDQKMIVLASPDHLTSISTEISIFDYIES